jgi:hypothetical protein
MATTIDLLDRATKHAQSERALSRALGISQSTFSVARGNGHLSPALAAVLADHIGESPTQAARCCLLAVAESKHSAHVRPTLARLVQALNSYFSSPRRNRTP